MAAAKMLGLVVTPTTLYSSTSACRLPLRMRSRDRSSSQTATPAFDSSASLSFCAMTGPFGFVDAEVGRLGGSAVAGGAAEMTDAVRARGCDRRCVGGGQALAGGRDHGVDG